MSAAPIQIEPLSVTYLPVVSASNDKRSRQSLRSLPWKQKKCLEGAKDEQRAAFGAEAAGVNNSITDGHP
jgi:hypothetical protein